MLKRKLKTIVFDADLKAEIKNYPVSDSGDRIKITKGGEAHFMPKFDHTTYIDVPRPWYKGGGYERTYFVRKLAKKCVDFKTCTLEGPDSEQLKTAIGSIGLQRMGQERQQFPTWVLYLLLLLNIGIAGKVFGVMP